MTGEFWQDVQQQIQADGSIEGSSVGPEVSWVRWDRGSSTIDLDGRFTVEELKQLIAHMESHPPLV